MLSSNDHQLKLVADRESAKARQIHAAASVRAAGPVEYPHPKKIFSFDEARFA
jgi:hypothetical protein